MRLDEVVIVVTGGANGLGEAMVRGFVAEGARVVGADIDRSGLASLAETLGDGPGAFRPQVTDVRSWEDVQQLVSETEDRWGRIDVLVSNAGIQQRTAGGEAHYPVQDVPIDIWEAVISTNLSGAFRCTKAVLPGMLARETGRLLYVSSGAGLEGRPTESPYVASKFGLEGLCETLAAELEDTGVDSVVFRPPGGGVYTDSRAYRGPDDYAFSSPDVITEAAIKLASGAGEHGQRYQITDDGADFVEEPR